MSVAPSSNTTYTGTFTATNGSTLTCSATVEVVTAGCTNNCGGGGGGGSSRKPKVVLESLKQPSAEPLAFVYLSETPYTGLEMGPVGTAMYWTMLVLWSAALGYLVLFNGMPLVLARARSFGGRVKDVLNTDSTSGPDAHEAPVVASAHGHAAPAPEPVATPQGYSAIEGFRSFAKGDFLTIDDLVNGLARETARVEQMATPAAPVQAAAPAAPVIETPRAVEAPKQESHQLLPDVHAFLSALIAGDRDQVFGTIRNVTRTGGDSEQFLTHAVCALDDAYRAKIDGTTCHPDIAALTADCHPSFLERLVSSLTTAVDGSYTTGLTGVKLAVTRALGVVQG